MAVELIGSTDLALALPAPATPLTRRRRTSSTLQDPLLGSEIPDCDSSPPAAEADVPDLVEGSRREVTQSQQTSAETRAVARATHAAIAPPAGYPQIAHGATSWRSSTADDLVAERLTRVAGNPSALAVADGRDVKQLPATADAVGKAMPVEVQAQKA